MENLILKLKRAKEASYKLAALSSTHKNNALIGIADRLLAEEGKILEANKVDVSSAEARGVKPAQIDRLSLNRKRINDMAEGLRQIVNLPDPIGQVISMWRRPNGFQIGQQRVPIGVIGMIYEARPNVTVDAVGLCLKAGNAVVLRGGSDAINSNKAIVEVINQALAEAGIPLGAVELVEDTSREVAAEMMKMNKYIDVLIPRGGADLIQTVIRNSTIPVIETGMGNCHIYVDSECDEAMAKKIIVNAKTQRPGVCNAVETLLVDEAIAEEFLPDVLQELKDLNVEIRGCEKTRAIFRNAVPASEEDWYREYLDYVLAVRIVGGLDEAVNHINTYGSRHSESIVTSNYAKARKFLQMVDAAAVYVNASTRFTDGHEFGFGAEIGISTQKLHARGPMGLKELTTIKYIIFGDGQIRE